MSDRRWSSSSRYNSHVPDSRSQAGQLGRWALAALVAWAWCLMAANASAEAIELRQVISREHPDLQLDKAQLVVGRDGLVYLTSGGNKTYVLRLDREGNGKTGAPTVYALTSLAANADGILATANAHFSHSVNLYDRRFERIASVPDFLTNDQVGWDAPAAVEAGPSGHFYAVDQHRNRVLKITPAGKVTAVFKMRHEDEAPWGPVRQFRVCEASGDLYWLERGGQLRCVASDGRTRWTFASGVGGDTWAGYRGAWDIDDEGRVYVLAAQGGRLQVLSPAGEVQREMTLEIASAGPTDPPAAWMRLAGDDVIVRRSSERELFQVFDRNSGAHRRTVRADVEELTVRFESDVWTAGTDTPLEIDFVASRPIRPRWRVWLRSLGAAEFFEVAWNGGRVAVPKSAGGLYQLRVTPGVDSWPAEYVVETLVEIRQPGARGSVSLATPHNRRDFGRGESIPVSVIVRAQPEDWPQRLTLQLLDEQGEVVARGEELQRGDEPAAVTLSSELTAALRPGRYRLSATAPGFTVAEQPLTIGPGLAADPPYLRMQFGDYRTMYPAGDLWSAPEAIERHLHRSRRLGVNLFVDRLGSHLHYRQVSDTSGQAPPGWEQRLAADPLSPAPEKARVATPFMQTMAAYSADDIRQMAILLYMDAGLPLGTGHDQRSREVLSDVIEKVTTALTPFPAFRGWSWNANWWVYGPRGAGAADTPEQKARYEAALRKAQETGAWDPVLDEVSSKILNYPVDAHTFFRGELDKHAPAKISALAGPYRNVIVYPPLTFRDVDEVDLHYQAEQIQPPNTAPHNVAFQKRPGKKAWGHPELWNDNGTGDQILPTLFQMLMRGADGIGCSGEIPKWGRQPEDPRNGSYGMASVFRALHATAAEYGPWLQTLQNDDRVAIVASSRMFRIDDWKGIGGRHFSRLFEAWQSCLYAGHPASIVFVEDVDLDSLRKFGALLLVDEQVELEPRLRELLQQAQSAGVAVCYDRTCRAELLNDFQALEVAFDHVDRDPHVWQDDSAYWRFSEYYRANAGPLRQALDAVIARPVQAADALHGVLYTQQTAGQAKFVWVVNNTLPAVEPGVLWRTSMGLTTRVPLTAELHVAPHGPAVYDVFARRRVDVPAIEGGKRISLQADLRSLPARLFAFLPAEIAGVRLEGPKQAQAGATISARVAVVADDGEPLDCALPVRWRLLDGAGRVVEERFAASDRQGHATQFVIPLNAGAGDWRLEASDLTAGRQAALTIAVTSPGQPASLASWTAPQSPPINARGQALVETADLPPVERRFGPHVRDGALLADGRTLVWNAFNWDHNLYAVDAENGQLRWRGRVGNGFAYAPQAAGDGLAVQGFDCHRAEGYHLYRLDSQGRAERRFALYGLPKRATNWMSASILIDRINNFATSPDGAWTAAAGDLGLAVWDREGRLLWSQDWHRNERKILPLTALSADTLLTLDGRTAVAYDAAAGRVRWQVPLAATGDLLQAHVSGDGRTVAVRASTDGGRVFLLRDGALVATLTTPADDLALTADGRQAAVVHDRQLKWYDLKHGLQWTFAGDDVLHFPRLSPDGQRLVVSSELGTIAVLNNEGNVLHQRDVAALSVPVWMPDGRLVVGGWMGDVQCWDRDFRTLWQTRLEPGKAGTEANADDAAERAFLIADDTPTTQVRSWSNAAEQPAPLTPNLLAETGAVVQVSLGDHRVHLQQPAGALFDGQPDPPPQPWIGWSDIQMIDSGWRGSTRVVFDTFRTQLRVTGVTLVEDPQHPNSWVRDAVLEYWDPTSETWLRGPTLLSDAAVHTHWFEQPIEAARFRLVSSGGTWPVGNLRWGEVVFHGEKLGASHPDVLARRPVAVLFDEEVKDFQAAFQHGHNPGFQIASGADAFSGGHYFTFDPRQKNEAAPAFVPGFGHELPHWRFEIAENPQPGEYRYLRFAYRALSPETRNVKLRLGTTVETIETPSQEWTAVEVDLWKALGEKPATITSLRIGCEGGSAAFDAILLGRRSEDFPTPGR